MVLPGLGNTFGQEAIPYHVKGFFGSARGGLVVTLMDVWVMEPAECRALDMVCWVPVDHEPVPPRVRRFLEQSEVIPIAMSRNGQDQLREFDPLYCPHAIDTSVFQPFAQEMARKKLGLPGDAFIVGMVCANKGQPSRKSIAEVLEAFAEFKRRHENAVLYLYTDRTGEFTRGVALDPLIQTLGLTLGRDVLVPDPYLISFWPSTANEMALLYSAMDVLANPSTGEGFGIPMLEAQACGTPVIATEWTAMREVAAAGWKVSGTPTWTAQHSWQVVPHVDQILKAFESCYALSSDKRQKLSARAREHAEGYDIERVVKDYMLPALEQAQGRLERRRDVVQLRKAA